MILIAWQDLSLMGKIYWIVAVPSTVLFLILIVMSLFGADADADADVSDVDVSEGFGGSILSLKSIISFLMMFGWAGIISKSYKVGVFGTILIAVVAGIIALIAVSAVIYFLTKLSHSGTMNLKNAIGKKGDVILRIPPKKEGSGQVQILVQGSLRTLQAVTEETEEIRSGTSIRVIDILNNDVLLVVPER